MAVIRHLGCAAALLLATSLAEAVGGCYATCLEASCKIPPQDDKTDELKQNVPRLIPGCRSAVTTGDFALLFRAGGKHRSVVATSGKPFKEVLAAHPALDCMAGDKSRCEAARVVPVKFGKDFDPSAPAEVSGEPCQLGLPCGKVGLRKDGGLHIRLVDTEVHGTLVIFPPRGEGGEQRVEVRSGAVHVPTLKPGQTYRYSLVLVTGVRRASGEFMVLSQRAQVDSDKLLDDAARQPEGRRAHAAVESLLLDGRDWEAHQLTLGGRP